MNDFDSVDSPPQSVRSGVSGVSGSSEPGAPNTAPLEKKTSFSNRKEFRKMDSTGSATSEALDFLADMCVEIDEIESALAPSPPPDMAAPARRIYGQNSGSNIFRVPSPRGPSPRAYFKKKSSESSLGALSVTSLDGTDPPLAHPHIVHMKVMDFGNKQMHLVPATDADVELILSLLPEKSAGQYPVINVSLEKGDISTYSPKNGKGPGKLYNPKHIYKTACDTYRVQMSKGSKTNPNGKFSRNTRSELDALWLCEFALILIDRPTGFDDILLNGNFKCLLQRGIVSSPEDFADKMHIHMIDLTSRGLLKPAEVERLNPLMDKYIPRHYPFNDPSQQLMPSLENGGAKTATTGSDSSPGNIATGSIGFQYSTKAPSGTGSIMDKARGSIAGLGSIISTQWGSFHDLDRKKRRRVPPTNSLGRQPTQEMDDDFTVGGSSVSAATSGAGETLVGGWLMSGQGGHDPRLSELTSQYVRSKHDSSSRVGDGNMDVGVGRDGEEDIYPYDPNDLTYGL